MASWYEDLVKSLDLQPADVATLFAGARSAVPIYALLGATGLNEGEDAEVARRLGPRPLPAPPPVSEEEQRRRMIEEFERNFPTPELRQAALQHMRAVRAGAYDPATATRRVDFAPQPPGPVMKPIDTSIRRKRYAGGGGVKKTVQQMADEMLVRGTKTAAKPDLARRSLLGLRPQSVMDMPIAKLSDAELSKLERQYGKEGLAPTITEREVQVSPDAGKTKSVLKSVTETPVSRRTVLKSAAGQAMQGVLPKGALPDMGVPGIGDVVKSVAQEVAPTAARSSVLTSPWAIAARMLREGKSDSEIASAVSMNPRSDEFLWFISDVRDPAEYLRGDLPTLKTPSEALIEMMDIYNRVPRLGEPGSSVFAVRPELRQMQQADPEALRRVLNAAKDVSMVSAETAMELGLKPKHINQYMRGKIQYEDLPQRYQDKIDNINAGFGDDVDY